MNIENVLIADDSKMIVKLIKKTLLQNKINGYHFEEESIASAHDGLEALDKVSTDKKITLIITEVDMPHLNGDDLIEILSDTNRLKDIKIIFMSTKEGEKKLSANAKKHSFGLIPKPFTVDKFTKSFNDILRKQKESAQNPTLINNMLTRLIQKALPKDLNYKDEIPALIKEQYDKSHYYNQDELFIFSHKILDYYLTDAKLRKPLTKQHVIRSWMMETKYKVEVEKNPYKLALALQKGMSDTKKRLESGTLTCPELEKGIFGYVLKQLQKIEDDTKSITPVNHKLFNPQYNALMKQFSTLDALFMDEQTALAYSKLKEIVLFVDFNIQLYKKQELFKLLPALSKHKKELNSRLKSVVQKSTLLTNKLCTLFNDAHIRRANSSQEIRHYVMNLEEKFIPSTANYFLHFNLITPEQFNEFPSTPIESVLLISAQKSFLDRSKTMVEHAFRIPGLSMSLEVAMKSKKALEIIEIGRASCRERV